MIDSYPWSATPTPADWPPLLQLRPEDVGFDGYSAPREGIRKEPSQSDSDADPLVRQSVRAHTHAQNRSGVHTSRHCRSMRQHRHTHTVTLTLTFDPGVSVLRLIC